MPTIDVTQVLTNIGGEPMRESKYYDARGNPIPKPDSDPPRFVFDEVDLRQTLIQALTMRGDEKLSAMEQVKRHRLAQRIYAEDEVAIDPDTRDLLVDLVVSKWPNWPLLTGQIIPMIDPDYGATS